MTQTDNDALVRVARKNIRHYVDAAIYKCSADKEAAGNCLDVMEAELDGLADLVAVLRSAVSASDSLAALRSPAPPCPKCGGVGQFEVLQPTVGASRIEVCDQCVGRSPAPVVDGKPCTVCKGSDPDCRWGGVPANCSMWGKDFPEATRPQPAQGEAFAWVDDLSWHQQAKRAVMASVKLGSWMSAALDDVAVCEAMKADIREWFSAGEPMEILTAAITALRQHSGESALRAIARKWLNWLERADDPDDDCDYLNEDGWDDVRALAVETRAALGGGA